MEAANVQIDSDWASDRVTRRSVSGGALMIGAYVLKTWSKDQGHGNRDQAPHRRDQGEIWSLLGPSAAK